MSKEHALKMALVDANAEIERLKALKEAPTLLAELLREEREARLEAEVELERVKMELDHLRADMATGTEQEWLNASEAAEELGVHVSTIYRAIQDGTLAGAKKIRGSLRIHRPTLLKSSLPKPGNTRRRRKQRS
jgi:excisionase family DNA binding protein